MRTLFATIAGFVAMFIVNGLMAAFVIGPLFEKRFPEIVANPPHFPILIAGYLVIAFAMALLYPQLRPISSWLTRSATAGFLIGLAVFLGAHTVIAGYTTIDTVGWIASGLFDSLGPFIGMLTIGYIYHRNESGL